jgi:transposase-like protein
MHTASVEKCTVEVVEALCRARQSGATYAKAAKSAGIHPNTLTKWNDRGLQGQEPFATFLKRWTQAEQDYLDGKAAAIAKPHDAKS